MTFTELAPFRHVNWRPSARDRRGFAISMLVGFALLGLLVAWRTHDLGRASFILWGIGAALAAGGLVPGLGRLVYLFVYVPTSLLGYVVSHVILTLVFGMLFVPLGLMLRLTGKDLLRLQRPGHAALWMKRGPVPGRESYYRQF